MMRIDCRRKRFTITTICSAAALTAALSTGTLLLGLSFAVQAQTAPAARSTTASPDPTAAIRSGRSLYAPLELARCKRITTGKATKSTDGDQDEGRWRCGGVKGYEIQFSEGDLRQFLAYGSRAREQRASQQTLSPFNSIFKDATATPEKDRATIQWRGTGVGTAFVPYATIVRYHVDTGDSGTGKRRRSQVLVVTRLGPVNGTEACHVAYIDAVANKDANALATKAADDMARDFDCRKEPAVLGAKGAVPPVTPTRT